MKKSNIYKHKTKYWGSLWILLIAILIVAFIGNKTKVAEVADFKATFYEKQFSEVKEENTKLRVVAQVATASSTPVILSDDQIKKILSILMPEEKDRERFIAILACENGTHEPKRVNINKPGSGYDLGIAMINSKFHASRVKDFFGQDFDEAMSNPTQNLVYAVYLYQHSGFEPWVCNKLVKNK